MNDRDEVQNHDIHIHITGFKAAAPQLALHDSQGIIDWSKVLACNGSKEEVERIVGLFKCRSGVPLKPTLRDRITTRSFTNTIMSLPISRFGLDSETEGQMTSKLGFPIVMGLFTASLGATNLLIQDFGFYHVGGSLASSPSSIPRPVSSSNPLGGPLHSCRVKIINLAPLVPESVELVQDDSQALMDDEEAAVLQQQRYSWIALHNLLYKQINSARQNASVAPSVLPVEKSVNLLNLL